MNRKSIAVTILTSLIVGVISFGLGSLLTYPKNDDIDYITPADDENINKFIEVYSILKYEYFSEVTENELVKGAINGLIDSLDDPYTQFFDIEETIRFEESISGEYEGIGAIMTIINDIATVDSPFKGSPAEKAGLLPKDQIIEVDGVNVVGMSLQEIVSLIKGEKGTPVTLGIRRELSEELIQITIIRDVIPIYSVDSKMYESNEKNIGYIDITQFISNTHEEFVSSLNELEANAIDGLIIDVRRNPGGLLSSVNDILKELMNDNIVFKIEEKTGNVISYTTGTDNRKEYPIVVLIDEGSASASEILAAALNESEGYELIGVKTFGKGTVQRAKDLLDGSSLKFTIQKWLTPDGNWIHNEGVKPTIEVEQPEYFNLSPVILEENLEYDTVSKELETLQKMLTVLGYEVREDGYYDKNTENVIKEFQKKYNLSQNGVINTEIVVKIQNEIRDMIIDESNDLQLQEAIKYLSK